MQDNIKWLLAVTLVMSIGLMANSGLGNDSDNREKESGGNIFNRLIDIISSILHRFRCNGRRWGSKGFLTLAVTMGWLADTSGVYLVLFRLQMVYLLSYQLC